MYIGSLPVASNRATYRQDFQLYDTEDNEGVSLVDTTITLELRRPGGPSPVITATNGSDARIAVTNETDGQFELTIEASAMRNLDPMTYDCGITIEQNGETTQYFIGTLPVMDGIVG